MMMADQPQANGIVHAAGGYGPPGGGGYGGPPPGGGGYGGPPGGGYGGPPPGGGYGGPPPGGGYGGPPPGGGYGGPPPGGAPPGGPLLPGAGGDVNTTLPLVLNIVAFLFCSGSCIGFFTAIAGIVFAIQASNALKTGDIATAQGKAKTSMTMFIVTAVLGLLAGVGWGVVNVMNQ